MLAQYNILLPHPNLNKENQSQLEVYVINLLLTVVNAQVIKFSLHEQ